MEREQLERARLGMDPVYALAVSGSDLYAGHDDGVAKWDGNSWSALGSGMNNGVSALAVSGSDLYAGGSFMTAGGEFSPYLARAILNRQVLAIQPDGFGGYFFSFRGVPGSDYRLQRAPNLGGPWATSSSQTAPASGLLSSGTSFPRPVRLSTARSNPDDEHEPRGQNAGQIGRWQENAETLKP